MKERLNGITEQIIGCALEIHSALGPGMLESAYDACLGLALLECGFEVEKQVPLPLTYRGQRLERGYRIDLLIERSVVVEVKAIDRLLPVHSAQLLSYLRLSGCKVGLLVNFNTKWLIKDGLKRVVNGFPD